MILFFRQLWGELWKLFARKRTYIGFVAFLALEVIILILYQLPPVQRSFRHIMEKAGYGFDGYFSGLTLAFQVVCWTVFLLGGLYIALVGGDIVAKEVEDGTMRMTLCRPVSRTRILVLKLLASIIYTAVLTVFIGTSALVLGLLRQGRGGFFVYQPLQNLFALYDFGPGLQHYFSSLPLLCITLLTVTSLAFMFSCFNMKPAAATICTLTYITTDNIFRNVPYFESIKYWLVTSHIETWYNAYRVPFPWFQTVEDLAFLFGFDATVILIGMIAFSVRDFKS
ncbi:MAG: ABC transporter permease subunit [Chthoniobacter sp.]|uniref:ABC transporter permease n=1 Tax=Chthoniobacter sp. TaxID=2510640 RepID=UPI0032A23D6C